MSLCEYCNKESKLLFICPQCDKRFCKEHRNPENHLCGYMIKGYDLDEKIEPQINDEIYEKNIQSIEDTISSQEIMLPIVIPESEGDNKEELKLENQFNISESAKKENTNVPEVQSSEGPELIKKRARNLILQLNEQKIPLTIIIIISLITGTLTGILVSPQEDTSLQQRYDTLYGYYQDLQSQNHDINQELESMKNEKTLLENQLNETQHDLSNIREDWEKVFSDNIQYIKPTASQLRTWLSTDKTDQQAITQVNTPLHQAIQLTLKAKNRGWNLGVIIVYGNFPNDQTNHTFNIVHIEDDLFKEAYVYLDPTTDTIWWNPNYEKITQDKEFTLGDYSSVYITKIDTILEP